MPQIFGFKLEVEEETVSEKKEEKKEDKKEEVKSVLLNHGDNVESEVKPEGGKRRNRKKK